jgi:DNA-binding GntR family transcriptional regulator
VHLPLILVDMPYGRRDQVLEVLRRGGKPLDDDEIADLAGMNRVYVNALCRTLAEDGLIVRRRGVGGKLVNVVADGRVAEASRAGRAMDAIRVPRTRMRSSDTQPDRIESLIAGFAGRVSAFE